MVKKQNPKAPRITEANKLRTVGVPEVKSYHISNYDLRENLKALIHLATQFHMVNLRYTEESEFFTLDAFGDTPPFLVFQPEIEPMDLRMLSLYMHFELERGTSHVFRVKTRMITRQNNEGFTLTQMRVLEDQLRPALSLQAYIDLVFAGRINFTTND